MSCTARAYALWPVAATDIVSCFECLHSGRPWGLPSKDGGQRGGRLRPSARGPARGITGVVA